MRKRIKYADYQKLCKGTDHSHEHASQTNGCTSFKPPSASERLIAPIGKKIFCNKLHKTRK
jgi:hypothetical protein